MGATPAPTFATNHSQQVTLKGKGLMKTRITRTLMSAALAMSTLSVSHIALADGETINGIVPIEQAKNNNVKTCLKAVTDISNFLVGDGEHGAHGVWATDSTDSHYTAVIERVYNDGSTTMNIVANPTPDGQCIAQYTKTIIFNENCMSALKTFDDIEIKGSLAENVTFIKHNAVDMYMNPIGKRQEYCQVIRKEVMTF